MEKTNEYLTNHPFPIRMEITAIEPSKPRSMDFGKITVCSKCGKGKIPHVGEKYEACCDGATLISLKRYTEEVLGVPFQNEKWSFKEENITLTKDIDIDKELT